MPTEHVGSFSGEGLRFAIVVSRFNEVVTKELLEGALAALKRHGVRDEEIEIAHVPGSFEMPLTAKTLAQSGRFNAVICLGCIIRGQTPHFDYVCAAAQSGILHAGLETGVPCIFGVLTTDNLEQAFDRAGGKAGNKGADAAVAAIEMANLMKTLKAGGKKR